MTYHRLLVLSTVADIIAVAYRGSKYFCVFNGLTFNFNLCGGGCGHSNAGQPRYTK